MTANNATQPTVTPAISPTLSPIAPFPSPSPDEFEGEEVVGVVGTDVVGEGGGPGRFEFQDRNTVIQYFISYILVIICSLLLMIFVWIQ